MAAFLFSVTRTDTKTNIFFIPAIHYYHSFADFALSLKMPNTKAFLLFKNVSLPEKKTLLHNKATPLARR